MHLFNKYLVNKVQDCARNLAVVYIIFPHSFIICADHTEHKIHTLS